jgi:DNA polymerase III alpha subunit
MITFARIQGKAALKEVFRTKFSDIPFEEVNKITDNLPDEAAISDKLQEMKEAGEEASIIMWALDSNAKALKPFCYIDEAGKLQGEYAPAFRQAVRLEGTKKSQGKHPSGIVIANSSLADIVPMIYDRGSKQSICGFEMEPLESVGAVKFDILGLQVLKKLHDVSRFLSGEPMI